MSNRIQQIKCGHCKLETEESRLFLNHTNWTETIELFNQEGYGDSEFIQFVKKQSTWLCDSCGSMLALKWGLLRTLVDNLKKEDLDRAILFFNTMMDFVNLVNQKKAISIVSETLKKLKTTQKNAYAILFALLRLAEDKSQNVLEQESSLMAHLKTQGMSNKDLAIIFQRSKSTVHSVLKEGR